MADNITKIGSSYDMVTLMQSIGSNYFGEDLSTQRIGMFGFTVESLANMFGAAILDASNRQREYNVYTANKRSTLLYEGSRLDVNIDNAIPAKMSAYLGILTTSLTSPHSKGGFGVADKNSPDPNHPNYKLVIEKDMTINIADYEFMVENDIQIEANYNKNTNSYTYSVQYLLEGDTDYTSYNGDREYVVPRYVSAYPVNDKYIQSYVQNYGSNISILLFKVELVNITKESKTQSIIKNDIISLTGMDFNYSNNLSHFNIFYRKTQSSPWTNIKAVPVYLSDENYEEDVIFYEVFHDEKKIRLNITDFQPAYNSEIRVDMYSTMGTEVNDLMYSGNGSDIVITLNTLDERHAYTGLELNCKPISSASGASDIPTLEELRARVIKARATVNSIDANYDLINYMESKDDSNDYVFIKKRNDVVERRYSCYMIPRLSNSDIIPSSTLDLAIVNFRENIDTDISHYDFYNTSTITNYKDALFSRKGLAYVGNQEDTEVNDRGVEVYTIDRIKNKITTDTDLDKVLVPFEGIYSSNHFDNFHSQNMRGLTRSTAYVSLYDYIINRARTDDNSGYSELAATITNTKGYNAFSGSLWPTLKVRNNLDIQDKYEMILIGKGDNVNDAYYYDITTKHYRNQQEKINESLVLDKKTNGALKNELYVKVNDYLNGTYVRNDAVFTNPIDVPDIFAFVMASDENGLYERYRTSNDELVFVQTRHKDASGNLVNIYQDSTNPFLTGSNEGDNWTPVGDGLYNLINIKNPDPNNGYSVEYINILSINDTILTADEIPSTDIRKFVRITTSAGETYISTVMLMKSVEFSNYAGEKYYYYASPYNMVFTDEVSDEIFKIFEISDTVKFTFSSHNDISCLFNKADLDGFSVDGLNMPEVYYANIDEYNDNYYYLIDKDITSPEEYNKGDFFILSTTNETLKEYLKDEYQLYVPKKATETATYIYYYINSDNTIREYIRYFDTISVLDFIIYETNSIRDGSGNNDFKIEINDTLGYFTHIIGDQKYSQLYQVTQLYYRKESNDNTNIGDYVYNISEDFKSYVKDISSTDVKGIKYATNNSGEKISITIKAGTPFGLVTDIVRNSNDAEELGELLEVIETDSEIETAGDTSNTGHVCADDCTCNVNSKLSSVKTDETIFGSINGDGIDKDPKAYYQYPIYSAKQYYGMPENGYTKEGQKFYKKNSLIPVNRYETNDDNPDEDKFLINETKGIYLSKNNGRLEDYMKVYTSPYTIMYDIENQVASFFLTAINKNINMNMIDEESTSTVNFSINSINIYRNPIEEYNDENDNGTYKITIDLMTNGDIGNATFTDKEGNTHINSESMVDSIMLKGFMYDSIGALKGWFDFDCEGIVDTTLNIFRFTGEIIITDELSETYCTTMTNCYMIEHLNRSDDTKENFIYNGSTYEYIANPQPENFLNLSISGATIGIGCYIIDRSYDMSLASEVQNGGARPITEGSNMSRVFTEPVTDGTNNYPVFVNKCKYVIDRPQEDGTIIKDTEVILEKYTLTNVYTNSMDLLDIYTDMSNYVKSAVEIHNVNEMYTTKYEVIDDSKLEESLNAGKVYVNNDGSYVEYTEGDPSPYYIKLTDTTPVQEYEVLHFTDIPVVRYSQCLNKDTFSRIAENITNAHENLTDLSYKITNNFSIDFKFFRTYGPCRYFKLERSYIDSNNQLQTSMTDLGDLDISIIFNLLIKNNLSISDADVVSQLKDYIKQRIEELNVEETGTDENDYTIYISNIITDIENKFNDYVRSIELVSINGYDSSYRTIYYDSPNLTNLEYYSQVTGEDIKEYVPEYINVPLSNITINVRRS